MRTIVLAKTEDEQRPVGQWRADLGERPQLETYKVARAMCWANFGDEDDEARALAYAEKDGWTVYTFETAEPDPLGLAKAAELLAMAAAPVVVAPVSAPAKGNRSEAARRAWATRRAAR